MDRVVDIKSSHLSEISLCRYNQADESMRFPFLVPWQVDGVRSAFPLGLVVYFSRFRQVTLYFFFNLILLCFPSTSDESRMED